MIATCSHTQAREFGENKCSGGGFMSRNKRNWGEEDECLRIAVLFMFRVIITWQQGTIRVS